MEWKTKTTTTYYTNDPAEGHSADCGFRLYGCESNCDCGVKEQEEAQQADTFAMLRARAYAKLYYQIYGPTEHEYQVDETDIMFKAVVRIARLQEMVDHFVSEEQQREYMLEKVAVLSTN